MMLCSEAVSCAGEVSPEDAWEALLGDASAQLVDVRSAFEWSMFGTVDLSAISKRSIMVEWNTYPPFARNMQFAVQLERKLSKFGRDVPLYFLCRSGWRSSLAAMEMARRGYKYCYNIMYGFEGSEASGSIAGCTGWKESGLPWRVFEMEAFAA